MTDSHGGAGSTSHDLLADVLAGHRAADDPAVLRACADPAVRERLDALLALQTRLDRSAAAEATVAATPAAPFDARIAALVRGRLHARPARPPFWRALLTLAAMLVVGATAYVLWPAPPPADYRLGNHGDATHGLRVHGGFEEVRWDGTAGRLWFQVRLRARDGAALEQSDILRANAWAPTRRDLPAEVLVELWLVDSSADPTSGRLLVRRAFARDGTPR
jgi:hypothetical protein